MRTDRTPSNPPSSDLGFCAILAVVAIISIWLLLMPVVPAVATATIHRFHLRTGSFAQWAIQQPIPAMYNLSNHFEFARIDDSGQREIIDAGAANHFPVRVITFADHRYQNLRDGKPGVLTIHSSYRDQQCETAYQITPDGRGGFVMSQMEILP